MNSAKRRQWIKLARWGITIIALISAVLILMAQDWVQVLQQTRKLIGWPLVIAILLLLFSRLSVALRWWVLMRSGGADMSMWQAMRITFAGLFASNILPTTVGGDVVRLAGAMQMGYGGARSAASLVIDRLVGMFGMSLFFPYGLVIVIPQLTTSSNGVFQFAAFGAVQKAWDTISSYLFKIYRKIIDALKMWRDRPLSVIASFGFTVLHMFFFFGMMKVLLTGLGENLSLITIGSLWSFVYFITLLPISVNGLGLQEVSITYVFVQFGHISPGNAVVFALLVRTLIVLLSLPGAFFIGILLPKDDESIVEKTDLKESHG